MSYHEIDVRSDEFQDDPNKAFGIGYSATGIHGYSAHPNDRPVAPRLSPEERAARAEADERYQEIMAPLEREEHAKLRAAGITNIEHVVPTNAGAHAAILKRTRDLVSQGYALAEADRIARVEQPDNLHYEEPVKVDPETAPDPERFSERAIRSLMHHSGGKGGGGSSSRAKPKKKGTWICKVCHLEFCEHRPAATRGRPAKFGERTERVRGRVSKAAKKTMEQLGLSPSDIIEITMIAINSDRSFEAVLAEYIQQRDAA